MGPKKQNKETLVLLINIGVTRPGTRNDSLLEKSKRIAQRIIEKKIFLRPKDEIGIMLMGSAVTKNSTQIDHIEELSDIQVANFDVVEKILKLEGTDFCTNWVEAIFVALQYIKTNAVDSTVKKMVLLSDFNEEDDIISQFEIDEIANMFQEAHVQLLTIGEELLEGRSDDSLRPSEAFLKSLHQKIDGQHETFDGALSDLRFYKEEEPKPYPWYCDLQLHRIKIPIATYIKVMESRKFPSWKECKDGERVKFVTEHLDRQKSTYEADETEKGYKYGNIFIPVDNNLEDHMKYHSGPKCYTIHSFANRDTVDLEYWCDSSTRLVVPSNPAAVKPFYNLVQAMDNQNLVAIVRKIYSSNCMPRMVALFPCMDVPDEPWCLVEVVLPFAEDRRVIETRPLRSVVKQLLDKQLNAVDCFLDSLMLTDTEGTSILDDSRTFLPGSIPDPTLQHRWDILSYRALHPDEPLPPFDDSLKAVLEVPAIQERSKCHLEKIAKLFDLERVNPTKKENSEEHSKEADNSYNEDLKAEKSADTDNVQMDVDPDSPMEPVLSLDTSDIDLDELACNI